MLDSVSSASFSEQFTIIFFTFWVKLLIWELDDMIVLRFSTLENELPTAESPPAKRTERRDLRGEIDLLLISHFCTAPFACT